MSRTGAFIGIFLMIFVFNETMASKKLPDETKSEKGFISYQSLSIGGIIGGQVYNDNFIYNPGFSVNYSLGTHIHKDVAVGLGTGYVGLSNEIFVPAYIELLANKKNKANTPFIRFQAGYAAGASTADNENFELNGGAYFSAGMGRKIQLNNNCALLLHWSYYHQFAELEYEVFGGNEYDEVVNYDMLQISVGIIFN